MKGWCQPTKTTTGFFFPLAHNERVWEKSWGRLFEASDSEKKKHTHSKLPDKNHGFDCGYWRHPVRAGGALS